MEAAGNMNKEKVKINIILEKRGALFLSKLYQKGFELVKSTVSVTEGKINYLADGFYLGGQKSIEKDILKIKDEIGPVKFDFQIVCSETECKKIEEQLKQKGLIIIKNKGRLSGCRTYTVKFDGGLEEATSKICEINFSKILTNRYEPRATS